MAAVESLQPTVPTECLVPSVLIATQVCEGPPDANSHPPVSWLQVCPVEALWTLITLCDLFTHRACSCVAPPHHLQRVRPFPVSSITFLWFVIHAMDVRTLTPWECVVAVMVWQQSRQMLRAPAGKGKEKKEEEEDCRLENILRQRNGEKEYSLPPRASSPRMKEWSGQKQHCPRSCSLISQPSDGHISGYNTRNGIMGD